MKLPNGISKEKLNHWLTTHQNDVFKASGCVHTEDTRFIYKPVLGAKILAVAHLDTVQKLCKKVKYSKSGKTIYAPCLDDRLGAYIVSDWLKSNEIKASVLLTDLEEVGSSTAQYFANADCYNWIVEFDRGGEDVVTYDLDSPEWINALEGCGFRVEDGSFSDICYLKTDRCCVNIGIGYEKAHGKDSYANLRALDRQLERFKLFYEQYKDTKFIQKKTQKTFLSPVKAIGDYCAYCGRWSGVNAYDEDGFAYCTECAPLYLNENKQQAQCESCLETFYKDELTDYGTGFGLLCEDCINTLSNMN